MRVVIGIDPGVNGAIAMLRASDGSLVHLDDVPVVKYKRKELHLAAYLDLVQSYDVVSACIEKVTATATGGVSSAFTFGGTFIAPQCFLLSAGIPYDLVTPNTWKKAFGLYKVDKDASRQTATRFYPDAVAQLKFKKDHNKADALLIARYHWQRYSKVLSRVPRKNLK